MNLDTDLMWELPPGTPAWEDLTPEEQAASIEALLVADYQAEQAQQEQPMHISNLPLLIGLVRNELACCEDNLRRAQGAFRNCGPEEMEQEYGQSGVSRAYLVNLYQEGLDQLQGLLQELTEGDNT